MDDLSLERFRKWIQQQGAEKPWFAGTFWFVLSPLPDQDFAKSLGLQSVSVAAVPLADSETVVESKDRAKKTGSVTFWHLPFNRQRDLHLLLSLMTPSRSLKFAYRLLARANGKAHLFPIGHHLAKSCVRLSSGYSFDETKIVRGVSYPSRSTEGGADINLKPGNASVFFAKLEEERRVLKLARMRAPVDQHKFSESTVGRVGYVSYHCGEAAPVLDLILDRLPEQMAASVKPFEEAQGRFVELRFPEPVFAERSSHGLVLSALARLPRTTLALIHANPYFHAALTNYEDGGQFDVFITNPSTIHIRGREDASPASFLRLHDSLAESFREARVELEVPPQFTLRDLLEGRV
jgi:hypothetical protein